MGIALNKAESETKKVTKIAVVERSGEKLVIPEGLTVADAIDVLKRKQVDEETVVTLIDDFDTFIWDGCWALSKALDERYGWYQQVATPGFFGDEPPAMIQVEYEKGKTVQVPWGRFKSPAMPKGDGFFEASYAKNNHGKFIFRLTAQIKKKWSDEFHALTALVREKLKTDSLYKGKAVTISYYNEQGKPLDMPKPEFLAFPKLEDREMVFPRDVEGAIHTNLLTPIKHPQATRRMGVPLKRGVLLAGDYGVGKTLVAFATARHAVDNGWTFVYCKKANEFAEIVRFAQAYAPAVVFCEDIDRVLTGERTEEMDAILNTIDGIDSKASEVVVVLTTNAVDKIHKAAIRPGRLDAVIHVRRPDAEAVTKLIKLYAGEMLQEGEDLTLVSQALEGHIPAVIRECVERSKLSALRLADGKLDGLKVTSAALEDAASTMRMQLELLNNKELKEPSDLERFGHIVGHYLKAALSQQQDASPETWEKGRTLYQDNHRLAAPAVAGE